MKLQAFCPFFLEVQAISHFTRLLLIELTKNKLVGSTKYRIGRVH